MGVNPTYSPFRAIIDKQRKADQHRENSARLAHAFGTFKSVGWGEYAFADRVDFEVAYLDRPRVSYGWSIDSDDEDNLYSSRYPLCSGGVSRWDIDRNGLYRGAWCIVKVLDRDPFTAPPDPNPDPNYTIYHDFTFLGVAMKPMDSAFKSGDQRFV